MLAWISATESRNLWGWKLEEKAHDYTLHRHVDNYLHQQLPRVTKKYEKLQNITESFIPGSSGRCKKLLKVTDSSEETRLLLDEKLRTYSKNFGGSYHQSLRRSTAGLFQKLWKATGRYWKFVKSYKLSICLTRRLLSGVYMGCSRNYCVRGCRNVTTIYVTFLAHELYTAAARSPILRTY